MSSLAHAKVTVPRPAGTVEVNRPRRPRAPSGIWGDGTELDALDDLSDDPTLERQFQVTNANVGPSAKGPCEQARRPFQVSNRTYRRSGERKPFITLYPPPVASSSALLLQVPRRNPKRKSERERGPPLPKRPNLIRNMNKTESPKGLWRFITLTGTEWTDKCSL